MEYKNTLRIFSRLKASNFDSIEEVIDQLSQEETKLLSDKLNNSGGLSISDLETLGVNIE